MVEVHLTSDEYTDDQVRQILENTDPNEISLNDIVKMQRSMHTQDNDYARNAANEDSYNYLQQLASERLSSLMDRDFDMVDADELRTLTEFASQFSSLPNMDSLRSKISNRAEVLNAVSAENSAQPAENTEQTAENIEDSTYAATPEEFEPITEDSLSDTDTPSAPEPEEFVFEPTNDALSVEANGVRENQNPTSQMPSQGAHSMQDLIKIRQGLVENNQDTSEFDSEIITLAHNYAQGKATLLDMNDIYDFRLLLLDVSIDQTDEQNREILGKGLHKVNDEIFDFEEEYGINDSALQNPQVIEENLALLGSVPTDEEIFEKDIDPKALKEASPEEAQKLIEQAPLKNPEFQDIKNILDAIEIKGKDKDKNHKDLFLKRIRLETDMYMANTQNPVSVSDYMEEYALRLRKGLVAVALTGNTALAELKAQDFEESFKNLAQAAQGKKKIQIQDTAFIGWQAARQGRIDVAVDRLGQKEGYKPVAARFKEKIDNLDMTLTKQLGKKYTLGKSLLKTALKSGAWGMAYSAGAAFGPVGIAAVGAASLGLNTYKFIKKVRADKKAAKEKGVPYKFWSTENALSMAGLAIGAITPAMGGLQAADLIANAPQIASAVSQSKLLAGAALGLGGALHAASKARAEVKKARQEAKAKLDKGEITKEEYQQMLQSIGSPARAGLRSFTTSALSYAAGMAGGMAAANAAQIGMPADMASVEASAPESSVANPSQEATIETPSQEATIGTPENGNNTNDAILEDQALTDKTVDIKIKMQPYALKAELESQGFDVDKAFSELGMDGAKPTSANMQTLYNALQEGKLDNVEGLDSGAMRDAIVGNAKDDFHSWRGEDGKLHSNWNEGHQPTNTQSHVNTSTNTETNTTTNTETTLQSASERASEVGTFTETTTAEDIRAGAKIIERQTIISTVEDTRVETLNNESGLQADQNTGIDQNKDNTVSTVENDHASEMDQLKTTWATNIKARMDNQAAELSSSLIQEGYVFHDTDGLVASVNDNLQRITDVDPAINGYKENYDADGNLMSIELGRISETSGSQQEITMSADGKVLSVKQNGDYLPQETIDNINNHPDNYPLMKQTICEAEKIHAQFHSLADQLAQEQVKTEYLKEEIISLENSGGATTVDDKILIRSQGHEVEAEGIDPGLKASWMNDNEGNRYTNYVSESGDQFAVVSSADGKILSVTENGHKLSQETIDHANEHPEEAPLLHHIVAETDKIRAQVHDLAVPVAEQNITDLMKRADAADRQTSEVETSGNVKPAEEAKTSTEEKPAQEVKAPAKEKATEEVKTPAQEKPATVQIPEGQHYVVKNGEVHSELNKDEIQNTKGLLPEETKGKDGFYHCGGAKSALIGGAARKAETAVTHIASNDVIYQEMTAKAGNGETLSKAETDFMARHEKEMEAYGLTHNDDGKLIRSSDATHSRTVTRTTTHTTTKTTVLTRGGGRE